MLSGTPKPPQPISIPSKNAPPTQPKDLPEGRVGRPLAHLGTLVAKVVREGPVRIAAPLPPGLMQPLAPPKASVIFGPLACWRAAWKDLWHKNRAPPPPPPLPPPPKPDSNVSPGSWKQIKPTSPHTRRGRGKVGEQSVRRTPSPRPSLPPPSSALSPPLPFPGMKQRFGIQPTARRSIPGLITP